MNELKLIAYLGPSLAHLRLWPCTTTIMAFNALYTCDTARAAFAISIYLLLGNILWRHTKWSGAPNDISRIYSKLPSRRSRGVPPSVGLGKPNCKWVSNRPRLSYFLWSQILSRKPRQTKGALPICSDVCRHCLIIRSLVNDTMESL